MSPVYRAAHTPGPWHRNIVPARKYPTIFAGRNTHVAVVQSQGLTDEEVEANCNLIAAAPELLAALQCFIALNDPQGAFDWPEYRAARAAIAKATSAA